MAQQQTRSRRDPDDEVATDERELAEYLQERIESGLNRGGIPGLARSIAKEIVHREEPDGGSEDAEADEQPAAEADDDYEDEDEPEDEAGDDYEDEDEDEDQADEDEDDAEAEADDDYEDEDESDDDAETDDEPSDGSDASLDFEAEMHELQEELGDDWILRFSVQGHEAWLTAEKQDGSQHVEATTAEVLIKAVELLEEGGDRSG